MKVESHKPRSLTQESFATLDAAIAWVERRGCAEWNTVWLSLLLALFSLATACPDYRHFEPYDGHPWANAALEWKFKYPWEPIPVSRFAPPAASSGIAEQLEKRSYRVTIPMLANVLGANIRGMLVVEQAAAVLFLGVFLLLARRVLDDAASALFVGVMAAVSFIGQWGFNDFTSFDGLSYLVLLLALWTRCAVVTAALVVLGGFCDERVILAAPLIWLWHMGQSARLRPNEGCRERLAIGHAHVGLVAGVVAFLALRLWLGHLWGQMASTSGMSLAVIKINVLWLPLGIACGLKGGIIIFIAVGLVLLLRHRPGHLVVGILACAPGILAALAVYDLSRSLAFGFPAYFIALRVLAQELGLHDLRRLTFLAALGCVTFPTYWILLRVNFTLPAVRFF